MFAIHPSWLLLATVASATCLQPMGPSRGPEPQRKRTTVTTSQQPLAPPLAPTSQYTAADLFGNVVADINQVTQTHVANLLEWEHERAFKYERLGQHAYWADPRIHNFGNLGWRGLLHALVVPVATHAIDRFAYSGVDARKLLHEIEFPADKSVVDLCCGVGFSSARNGRVTAVDTSQMMLTVAKLRRPDIQHFEVGNAEEWGEVRSQNNVARTRRPRRLRAPALRPRHVPTPEC